MTVRELSDLLGCKVLAPGNMESMIESGYVCDFLSWVMARCGQGAAWITVQTHLNVVAVAVLLDIACVIIPDSVEVEQESIDKANEEGVALLSTAKTAYEVCGLMYQAGLGAYVRK